MAKTKTINSDGRTYKFTPGKGGSLLSPSRQIGKPGLMGTFQNKVKSKVIPMSPPMKPTYLNQSQPGATRGEVMKKKKNVGIVRALSSNNAY